MATAKVIIPFVIVCLIVIGYAFMSKRSAEKQRVVNDAVARYKEVINRHSEEMRKFPASRNISDEQNNLIKQHSIELQDLRNKIRSETGISVEEWKNSKNIKGIRWSDYVKDQLPTDVKWEFIPN